MNESPHRNYQKLAKIGPVFSDKDEKQRVIAEEVLNYRLRPEFKLKINLGIPGLERKKTITSVNPTTRRLVSQVASKGKEGWLYLWIMPNCWRFAVPFFVVAFFYYAGENLVSIVHHEKENMNGEFITVYPKFQTISNYNIDRWSLMA